MQHGLPVKAHDIDAGAVEAVVGEKISHGGAMPIGDDRVRLRQHAGARVAIGQGHRFIERGAQRAPFRIAISKRRTRPLAHIALAVGFDKGDVDTVHGCARHQADRSEPGHEILHQMGTESRTGRLINWLRP